MGIVAIKKGKVMKKFLVVKQDAPENTVVQVSYDNKNYFTSRFACITVIEGPDLSFGQWLFLFKEEIIKKYSEDIEKVLEEYNEFYSHAHVEAREMAREMFRQAEDQNWNALAEMTAFEKVENDSGTEYQFVSKRIIEPMFSAGAIHIDRFLVTPDWTVRRVPKHVFVICAMWKYFDWNRYIEETTYEEFEQKEYDWNTCVTTVTDILG